MGRKGWKHTKGASGKSKKLRFRNIPKTYMRVELKKTS
jgi:hypothetical protein